MTDASTFRTRLRAIASARARGDGKPIIEMASAEPVTLEGVWPAERREGFWSCRPPWPAGYPLPAPAAPPALAVDVESLGRTPRPVFLVGLARVSADGVAFEQLVSAHPQEELALLKEAREALNAAPLLVSYNGLTFDLPILRDRLAYWKEDNRISPRHVDILHVVRRRYRNPLDMPACSLTDAERYLLGVERPDDLPSAQVPIAYERAVQSGDARPLLPVLRHNLYDLAATALIYLKVAAEYPADLVAPAPPRDDASLF